MEAKAKVRFVRVPPRKAREVMDLIRNKDTEEAKGLLKLSSKEAASVMEKLLNSACANAENNFDLDPDNLYIAKGWVDEGPTLKRFRPRAMGRATPINKRTSHITMVVKEKKEG